MVYFADCHVKNKNKTSVFCICHGLQELVKTVNILDAIFFLKKAMIRLRPDTIIKCFRNCGFYGSVDDNTAETEEQPAEELADIAQLAGH